MKQVERRWDSSFSHNTRIAIIIKWKIKVLQKLI